jgi:alpha-1,2-mannosyltransferase
MGPFAGKPGTRTRARSALANHGMVFASWGTLMISAAVYLTLSMHSPFHVGARALNEFDLRVYHGAAQRLASGQNVYGPRVWRGLGFTYPPFAALVFLPLAWLAFTVDHDAVTVINVMLLIWMLRRALLIPAVPTSKTPKPMQAWAIAAFAGAGAIWLEPVSVTLGYGQINVLIAALVIFDLSLPDDRRGKGMAIGVAAAIKLTPLLFIVYLLLTGRRRAAMRASAVFAGSIALAYAVAPRDAASYWGHGRFLRTTHIGDPVDLANQSLRGALLRLSHTTQLTVVGYLVIGVVVLTGLALATRAARRGDHAAGYSLAALTTLLASPISWTHHWTLIVPAVLLLAHRAHQRRSPPLWAATGALCLLGFAYAPEQLARADLLQDRGPLTIFTTDPYVLAALLALAVTATVSAHTRLRRATTASIAGIDELAGRELKRPANPSVLA